MRRGLALVLLALLAILQAPAQARAFSQPELEALLAPIALYPDAVLSHVLVAATHPDDLREAAAWSRANPQLSGESAVRAADREPWHPSVKALVAFPDLLARMDESPQWISDLAQAFVEQEPHVMDTVQALRRRAQINGGLESDGQYSVEQHGGSIAVVPAQPHYVYVPYYNPYVVYGPWWHTYRPVYWRPWHPRPAVFVHSHFHSSRVDWHRRHVVRHVHHHHHHHHRPHPVRRHEHRAPVTIHNHAHPVRPIIQGSRIDPPRFRSEHREHRHHEQRRAEAHREHRRAEPRREHRHDGRQAHRPPPRRG